MCNLCDEETREKEGKRMILLAVRLEAIGKCMRAMASGEMKPHSGASEAMGLSAVRLAHHLIKEYA